MIFFEEHKILVLKKYNYQLSNFMSYLCFLSKKVYREVKNILFYFLLEFL